MTEKQKRFIEEYLVDLNASAAAKRAGYKNPEKGRQLVAKSNVTQAIQARIQDRAQRIQITQDEILKDLIKIKNFCMDEEHFDAKNAIKVLELCGRHLGMFTDKLKTDTTENITIRWQT